MGVGVVLSEQICGVPCTHLRAFAQVMPTTCPNLHVSG